MAQLAGLNISVSEETLRRIRDYAVNEPSFTATFAAWDLSQTGEPISAEAVRLCVVALVKQGVVELIEDGGTGGKVYAYKPPPEGVRERRLFGELDDSRDQRPAAPVPHTRAQGPSGKPGRDRKRQARGVRIKHHRNGT